MPVVPQVDDAVVAHIFCGSGAPFGTALHRPRELVWLQATHGPLQTELQQTPWAQKLERHSAAELHGMPPPFFPHEPLTHVAGATHCESFVQVEKQAVPPLHVYGSHGIDDPGTHCPTELHVGVGVRDPSTQEAVPHGVPVGYFWHERLPSQNPLVPQLSLPRSLQLPLGSVAPGAAAVHLPCIPGTLQLRHAPAHAFSQQTPSMHCPDSHSAAPSAQGCPSFFLPHWPTVIWLTEVATHRWPGWQSPSVRQVGLHAPIGQLRRRSKAVSMIDERVAEADPKLGIARIAADRILQNPDSVLALAVAGEGFGHSKPGLAG